MSIESARGMGYKSIYLESIPDFEKAVSMYERTGFRILNAPLGQSGLTNCNLWMLNEL
jgi:putative acetyltransferase